MLKLSVGYLDRKDEYYVKNLKFFENFTVNTNGKRIEYLALHFLGRAKRYGWKTVLPILEGDKSAEEIKEKIRQIVGKK